MIKHFLLYSLIIFSTLACDKGQKVNTIAEDINNQSIHLPSKEGKWVVVNYWAAWCPPCREEIAELNAFHASQQDKAIVVGVNADMLSVEKLQAASQELNINYPLLKTDPINILSSALEGLPSTYLVSPKGKVYGPILGKVTMEDLLDEINAS